MSENNTNRRTPPSQAHTAEFPPVTEELVAAHAETLDSLVTIQPDGTHVLSEHSPATLTDKNLADRVGLNYSTQTLSIEALDDDLTLVTVEPAEDSPAELDRNPTATAITRAFHPEHAEVLGTAVFVGMAPEGSTAKGLRAELSEAITAAATEVYKQVKAVGTPTLTLNTRAALLNNHPMEVPPAPAADTDGVKAVEEMFEESDPLPEPEAGPQPKYGDARLPWTLTGLLALSTGVLAGLLYVATFASGGGAEDTPQPTAAPTETQEAPSPTPSETVTPYDPSQAIEDFDQTRRLDEREEELNERSDDLDEREAALEELELNAGERVADLDQRETAILDTEDRIQQRQDELNAAIDEYNEKIRELNQSPQPAPAPEPDPGVEIPLPGTTIVIPSPGN